jgi:putative endonuclease
LAPHQAQLKRETTDRMSRRSAESRRGALRVGAEAEQRAAAHLEGFGWEVVERNWRGGGGELDLVVRRGACLRLVEVKARKPDDPVGPFDAVDARKRRRLVGAGRAWLRAYADLYDEVCFMVVAVEGDRITVIDDAFDG